MDEWGLVPRRNSINKHKAVHVLHVDVFEPWTDTFSHTDNSDILECTCWAYWQRHLARSELKKSTKTKL